MARSERNGGEKKDGRMKVNKSELKDVEVRGREGGGEREKGKREGEKERREREKERSEKTEEMIEKESVRTGRMW